MDHSRRGRIVLLMYEGKSDAEILSVLDKEFPPGAFRQSNKQALASIRSQLKIPSHSSPWKRMPSRKHRAQSKSPTRNELVALLRAFHEGPALDRYRKKLESYQSPAELLASVPDKTIWRAFRYEFPSQRYKQWRWRNAAELLFQKLDGVENQEQFDLLAFKVGESLVDAWGATNNHGEPSRMHIGIAMKITNLAFKHATFSDFTHNPRLRGWLHVPWDRFTLEPLCGIWQGHPAIQPRQGFVKNRETYLEFHSLITSIAQEAGVDRITYEFWAWDLPHQNSPRRPGGGPDCS